MTSPTPSPDATLPGTIPEDVVVRLKAACNGHPHAKIAWPHRLLHDAIAEIERLRAAPTGQPEAPDEFGQTGWDAGWNAGYCDGYNEAHTRYALAPTGQPQVPGVEGEVVDVVAKAISRHGYPEHRKDDGFAWWWNERYDHPGNTFEHESREEDRIRARAVIAALSTHSSDPIRRETAEERIREDERAAERERLRFEGDLDRWMKVLGAGITGYQPEAYAVMDAACHELVKSRALNAELKARVAHCARLRMEATDER